MKADSSTSIVSTNTTHNIGRGGRIGRMGGMQSNGWMQFLDETHTESNAVQGRKGMSDTQGIRERPSIL